MNVIITYHEHILTLKRPVAGIRTKYKTLKIKTENKKGLNKPVIYAAKLRI